ncbi:hypothetical protein [Neisseria chenwenguii]|uniref:hypothetical protein n=1 Tax=Neisseria chenwenguii TaxID=1853278 RepID=UPI000F507D59|nr:hypothetical protein [Neisseria chenwenguii]
MSESSGKPLSVFRRPEKRDGILPVPVLLLQNHEAVQNETVCFTVTVLSGTDLTVRYYIMIMKKKGQTLPLFATFGMLAGVVVSHTLQTDLSYSISLGLVAGLLFGVLIDLS